jgi:hypothetical protein
VELYVHSPYTPSWRGAQLKHRDNFTFVFFKKALTVLRGPLAYPNGLLDLHIETFGRTPWPGDQPDARALPTQDNKTQ